MCAALMTSSHVAAGQSRRFGLGENGFNPSLPTGHSGGVPKRWKRVKYE